MAVTLTTEVSHFENLRCVIGHRKKMDENLPKVCIVIVNWNNVAATLDCIRSVSEISYDNYELIVIDNGSSDRFFEEFTDDIPSAKIIRLEENIGYTGANNLGIELAIQRNADYIWLLNNDTIVDSVALSNLVDTAETISRVGLVSPVIYYFNKPSNIQFCGSYVDWTTMEIIYPIKNDSECDEVYQYGNSVCLWGTALLISSQVVKDIGYLASDYFAYWEDTEYSIRSLKYGLRNIVCNKARVYHRHNTEDSGHNIFVANKPDYFYYYMARNKCFLLRDCERGLTAFRLKIASIIHFISMCKKRGTKESLEASLLGAWHGIRNIGGPMKQDNLMPKLIRIVLMFLSSAPPYFWAYLLEGKFKYIYVKGKEKIFGLK